MKYLNNSIHSEFPIIKILSETSDITTSFFDYCKNMEIQETERLRIKSATDIMLKALETDCIKTISHQKYEYKKFKKRIKFYSECIQHASDSDKEIFCRVLDSILQEVE